jgi:peptidoglycan/xylan/chitin deacetylase (PgdA/CDA1 family)
MFHQVNDNKQTFYPGMSVSAFRDLITFIKKYYTVIKLSEIKSHFTKTNNSAAIITFDDGHYDIIEHAFPVLSEFNLPFNVNIDTEILETGKPQDFVRIYDVLNNTDIKSYMNHEFMQVPININRENHFQTEMQFTEVLSNLSTEDRRKFTLDFANEAHMNKNKYSRMLSGEDIKFLSENNVEFGSHSHTHSILTKLNSNQVHYELSHSKSIIEKLIEKPIHVLAYPNGVFNEEVEKIAKKINYEILLQTNDKINNIDVINHDFCNFNRINQYHQSIQEALAHTYGLKNIIKI